VVRALDRCAVNRVYNLGGDEPVTIRELAEAVREHVGDVEVVHVPGRTGDFGGAEVSSDRADKELGWRASTPLREGIGRYLTWLNDTAPATTRKAAPAVPAPAPTVAAPPAAAGSPVPQRLFASIPLIIFAFVIGSLLPYLLALRLDEFNTSQAHSVAVTTLFAILVCISIGQSALTRNTRLGVRLVGWLVIGYVFLLTVPWPEERPLVVVPEIQTLVMSALGAAMALGVVSAASRLREPEAAAPDRLT
jgi:hypothetical protein